VFVLRDEKAEKSLPRFDKSFSLPEAPGAPGFSQIRPSSKYALVLSRIDSRATIKQDFRVQFYGTITLQDLIFVKKTFQYERDKNFNGAI
jgi:hypothetical protein